MNKINKLGTLIILVCLAMAMSTPLKADTMVVDQIADGPTDHIIVGNVTVNDDGFEMTVTFEITEPGWLMTQTHLAVAELFEDIPQTGSGNPQVGKFTVLGTPGGVDHDPPVTTYTYGPFAITAGTTYYIAAHASVIGAVENCYEQVWQIGDVETYECEGGTQLTNYADEFNWGEPADECTEGPTLAVDQPPFANPFIVGTTQTEEFPFNSNCNRGYATDFDVQWSGELLFGGILTLSWSPGQSAAEKKVVSDGFSPVEFTAVGTPRPGESWFLDTYPLVKNTIEVDPLADGVHTIRFQHTQGDGTYWDWIRLEKPCERKETAWGDGTDFGGKSWATYFTYQIPCVQPSGSLSITGTGWKSVSAWCPCDYKYDLSEEILALMGWVDTSEAALANTGDWSKYYAKFSLRDSGGRVVEVVLGDDWLGPWYEMNAQQWDRIRMENNMGLTQPERYYATLGGVLGYDMDGYWVGAGNGAAVYPSDQNYFFQLIVDPVAKTFTLEAYAKGSGAEVADPPPSAKPGWPKQNMFDEAKWLEIGTITAPAFDFSEVDICAILWASTQAGASETSTIEWWDMQVGTPISW